MTRAGAGLRAVAAVAFDLDGTLVDSRRDLAESVNELLGELGGRPLAEAEIVALVGGGVERLVTRALAAAGLQAPTAEAVGRYRAVYARRLLDHTRPYPGVGEMLERLAARVPLGVLTNKPEAATREILEGLGLAASFRNVVGGDGAHPLKPDPAGLRWLARELGASPAATLLVGDSEVDRRTAGAAGASFALAGWGFGAAGVTLGPEEVALREPAELARRVLREEVSAGGGG